MVHVIVPDLPPRVTLVSTGGTDFAFPFTYFEDTDLDIYVDNVLQTLTTDYTINGVVKDEGFEGGTIVFVAPVAVDSIVTIVRDIPVERLTDFPEAGPFDIVRLNTELDKIIAMIQEREANQDTTRIIGLDPSDPDANLTLCLLEERRNKYLAFDANGDVICLPGTAADPNAVTQSGTVTPGNIAEWVGSQVIQDGGIAVNNIQTISNSYSRTETDGLLDGKMDLVNPVNAAGNAVVIDTNGQAHDADVPLAVIVQAQVSIPAASWTTTGRSGPFAHNMGAQPQFIGLRLTMQVAVGGWLIGDELFIAIGGHSGANTTRANAVSADGTNLYFHAGNDAGGGTFVIPQKDGSGVVSIGGGDADLDFFLFAYTGVVPAP